MRLAIVLVSALLLLAAPRAASAQVYCATGSTGSSGFASYVPTGYSHYSGFASFPGAMVSGTLPAGYNTNPYIGCAPTTATSNANPYDPNANANSAPSYSAVIASNVYNPYSGWGLTNAASYPFASYGNSAATTALGNLYGSASLYSGFAGFPGMAPSGYLTAGTTSSTGASSSASATVAAPFSAPAAGLAATPSYGGYSPAAISSSTSNNASYYNAAGVTIYYGGANASANGSGASAGSAPTYSGFGTSAGYGATSGGASYYTYGNGAPAAAPYSGVSTMVTYGCGSNC